MFGVESSTFDVPIRAIMLAILDVLIGLVFIYGLFSVLVSAATELLLTIWSQRGKTLWMAVKGMLPADASTTQTNVVNEFLKHPLVRGLGAAEHDPNASASNVVDKLGLHWAKIKSVPTDMGLRASFPSYLPTHVFVDTIMHMLRSGSIRNGNESDRAEVGDLIRDVASEPMRNTLSALHLSAQELGIPFRTRLEFWFNDSMDRASGWYKRMAQIVMIMVAFILAVWCNVDTLRIIAVLSGNSDLRKSVADSASEYVTTQMKKVGALNDLQNHTPPPSYIAGSTPSAATAANIEQKVDTFNNALKQIDTLGLPIGWGKAEALYVLGAWPLVMIGWMMSALAATLGANFWFQLLGNLVKLRITGSKPDASPPAASTASTSTLETRQLPPQTLSLPVYAGTEPMQAPPPPAGYGLESAPMDSAEVAYVPADQPPEGYTDMSGNTAMA
jgi:hypothetical protein